MSAKIDLGTDLVELCGLADLIGVTPQRIDQLRLAGRIPAVRKVRGRWCVPRAVIEGIRALRTEQSLPQNKEASHDEWEAPEQQATEAMIRDHAPR